MWAVCPERLLSNSSVWAEKASCNKIWVLFSHLSPWRWWESPRACNLVLLSSWTMACNWQISLLWVLEALYKEILRQDPSWGLRFLTLAWCGSTMVLQVRAVFTLVVIGAFAEVVRGQVETLRPVLTWVGLAVIDIQLYRRKIYKRRKESSMMRGKWYPGIFGFLENRATLNSLDTASARKKRTKTLRRIKTNRRIF